jgi:hypothetical protein
MGKFFFQHALISTPTALCFNMCAAPLIGMVQSGTNQEVLAKAAVADFEHRSKRAKKLHAEENADGQSLHAVKMGTASHKVKNAGGKSVAAVKMANELHSVKNDNGKSVAAVKMANELHSVKNDNGQSVHAVKLANELHSVQNADGQSLHAVKMATASHKVKNADGQSVHAVKMGTAGAAALHKEKNADGNSVAALEMQSKRKYNGHADEETANYKCPNCLKYFVFDSPRDKRGNKRVHQQCGNKAQILVPYHAPEHCVCNN